MTQILIAHQNLDRVDDIKELLNERFASEPGSRPIVTYARNGTHALAALDLEAPQLVIVELDLPEDKHSGPVPLGGLRFAEAVQARHPHLPLVFISPYSDPDLSAKVDAIGDAALVLEGQSFESDLKAQVLQGLAIAAAPPRDATTVAPPRDATFDAATVPPKNATPVRYVIEIYLREAGNCTYRVRSIGDRVPYGNQLLPFQVEPIELQKLKAATARLVDSQTWAEDYAAIGERLFQLLLDSNTRVIRDLGRLDERMANQMPGSRIALCFVVDEGVYPIALEALRDAEGPNRKYWLERAPLWRQLDLPARQYALFQDPETREGPINCLIVEADTAGGVESWDMTFLALPSVRREADSLDRLLRTQESVRIGRIGRVQLKDGRVWTSISENGEEAKPAECRGSFADELEKLLTTGEPWHLVHYAGHSHYDERRKRGYLVLPGLPSKPGEAAPLEQVGTSTFANWLYKTRLVYMSSCRGSSQAFVYNLCEYNVAAVTGFRWNINDGTADVHSRRFYEELFKRRSIEDALHSTWNHMYDCHPDDRVWISSELVMQLAA